MRKKHILVVEDHESMLKATQGILEAEGYTVSTAKDGIKALQIMEEARPDLILADIMMPRMDGYTFYEKVRSRPEWVPIPFIFLSAKSEEEDVLRGKKLGAEDYITKPFEPHELVITVRSRLKRARAVREATEARLDQLKQQIVTVLGHELRTPLTYVTGYTDLALEDISSLSSDEMKDFLMGIKQGTDRLNRLVEDLLLLVQVDTGQAAREFDSLVTERQDLGEIVRHTVRQHEKRATEEGVTLKEKVPSHLPPVRLCEEYFIDALGRLVENGIKFSGSRGEKVTVSARADDEGVEISVSDEGVGIPEDKKVQLFERFQQVSREKLEQQGVGLGLPIARELIRLHDGEITVESTAGEGSTFTIRLPRLPAEAS